MKFITLPIYRLATLLSTTKERFKALWTLCFSPSFPCISGAAPAPNQGAPEFITEDHNTEPSQVFMTFTIVLPTPSLHIEMVTYCTSYTNNRTRQIVHKHTGIKICYKIDTFAFEGNKSKGVRGTVLTYFINIEKLWSRWLVMGVPVLEFPISLFNLFAIENPKCSPLLLCLIALFVTLGWNKSGNPPMSILKVLF